ncbi:alkaline phosphatase family protein [Brevibacillus laterosporus]|uniref:Alkaline phosphatase family protein n=1 Tax=Brevibacillus halotolerans TaxID=1507437 RepID=A0ABT4HVH2_9BACL|nr:alkaline phosphatase family protein [Brevibacillus laterosporus]MCR8985074.1 alkaline phosphatase family protein [Brevibacillus laterosporus]MCZ0830803.1 alkaline phosphatase family protein [Brevibacillus halotolerans]
MLRKLAFLCLLFLICISLASCSHPQPEQIRILQQPKKPATQTGQKVIVLMVDSILSDSIDKLVTMNKAPALSFLIKNGMYRRDLISSFPTMSVTIESSLLTGAYADQHKIPGLLWFHPEEKRIVNYGDGFRVAWKPGLADWAYDSIYNLNRSHLSSKIRTLHEDLHKKGFTTASINTMVYRGDFKHTLVLPKLVSNTLNLPAQMQVMGPEMLGFGSLRKLTNQRIAEGPFQSFGVNDSYTTNHLINVIKQRSLPDLTIAYFPDMDGKLHKHGPTYLAALQKFDKRLQSILDAFGDWNKAIENHTFMIIGDSGVTSSGTDRQQSLIRLEKMLGQYQPYRLGKTVLPSDDIAFAINGRMSYVYSLSSRASIPALVDGLKHDDRIDFLAWKEADWIHVRQGNSNRQMAYRPGKNEIDRFGQRWDIRGDFSVLDLRRNPQDNRLDSSSFPDGLQRLFSAFASHKGSFLVISAKNGAEFTADGSPNHLGGGNHGSLHRTDTLIPLIIAGKGALPPPDRIVDLKPYIIALLTRDKQPLK